MKLTLLLDLDNTLLDTKMDRFLPAYYAALAKDLSSRVPPERMLPALQAGVKRMLENDDPARTLQEVFEAEFYPRLGTSADELRPAIVHFYEKVVPTLGVNTRPQPGARALIDWALAQGHEVAIATDPLFPQLAVDERIRWAGIDPKNLALVASYETFHFTKSRPAYFAELIGRLGWPDRPVIMAGDDLERDVRPAQAMGLPTYHVDGATEEAGETGSGSPGVTYRLGSGDLIQLQARLESSQLEPYSPPLKDRTAVLAMLEATPGVLQGLTAGLDAATWAHEPSAEDWALIELVCHLRDTEREIHREQIRTLVEAPMPFVPRPDAAVWAKQRKYLNENGPEAVREFTQARIANLARLKEVPDAMWTKPAKHAIFGPTSFVEVIGFMADHDRMHLQQAWATLRALAIAPYRS